MIRSYKYAIKPTLSQKNEINRVLSSSRKCWNEMIALMNYAEKEYHLGHAGSLVLESINLLNKYDNIKIGNWRGKTGKDYNHALSTFTAILEDKANLSVTPKNIESINEKYTTQTCPNCGEKTGPKGVNDLNIRNWICSNCGKTHDRDYASATNIARCLNTAEAHSVSTK